MYTWTSFSERQGRRNRVGWVDYSPTRFWPFITININLLFLIIYRSLRNGYIKLPVVLDPAPLPPRPPPPPPPPPFHQPAGFNSREERYRSEDSTSRSGFPSGNGYTAASRMTKYYVILAYRLSEISNLTPAVLFNNG